MAKYNVVTGFHFTHDDGRVEWFGPGQVVPDELVDHWFMQGKVGEGRIAEEGREVPVQEAQPIGGDSIPYPDGAYRAPPAEPAPGVMLGEDGKPLQAAPDGSGTVLTDGQVAGAEAELSSAAQDTSSMTGEEAAAEAATAANQAAHSDVEVEATSTNNRRRR